MCGTGGEGDNGGDAEVDIEAQAFGVGPVGQTGPAPGPGNEPGGPSDNPGPGQFGGIGAPGTSGNFGGVGGPADLEADQAGRNPGALSPGKGPGPSSNTVGKVIKNVLPFGVPPAALDPLAEKGGRAITGLIEGITGAKGQAPGQGPSTGSEGGPASDFGESGNFGGVGFGGGNTGGDGAVDNGASRPLATSVQTAERQIANQLGRPAPPARAPALDLPSSNIDEIRAELEAEKDARRRRRRATRDSTIVTGPLGVPGQPELLFTRAIPGASRRLLGQ